MKRDIQIKLKAVSADHCAIAYTNEKGWTITERGKDRLSSNGTFIFMKSMQQMNDHVPSDMIPLHDDMVISFVNYELRVSLLQKTKDELVTQQAEMEEFFANKPASSVPVAATPDAAGEAPKQDAAYTAEVNANAEPEAPATGGEEKPAEDGAAAEEKPAADGENAEDAPRESTEQELADAATKISAVYRGNKARQEVAAKKEAKAGDENAE